MCLHSAGQQSYGTGEGTQEGWGDSRALGALEYLLAMASWLADSQREWEGTRTPVCAYATGLAGESQPFYDKCTLCGCWDGQPGQF